MLNDKDDNQLDALLQPIMAELKNPNITDILIYGSKNIQVRERGKAFEHRKDLSF